MNCPPCRFVHNARGNVTEVRHTMMINHTPNLNNNGHISHRKFRESLVAFCDDVPIMRRYVCRNLQIFGFCRRANRWPVAGPQMERTAHSPPTTPLRTRELQPEQRNLRDNRTCSHSHLGIRCISLFDSNRLLARVAQGTDIRLQSLFADAHDVLMPGY